MRYINYLVSKKRARGEEGKSRQSRQWRQPVPVVTPTGVVLKVPLATTQDRPG